MERTVTYMLGYWESLWLIPRYPKTFYKIKAEFVRRKGEGGSENRRKKQKERRLVHRW